MGQPFLFVPPGICDDLALPAFPTAQDCTTYSLRLSQVCAAIILPDGATPPTDWSTYEGWAGTIDNSDLTGTKARYLVGIGSFLPTNQVIVDLGEQRLEEVRDREYTFQHAVLNMALGHLNFGRQIEQGYKDFGIWLETLGGRIVGGPKGMRPVFVDAKFPLEGGKSSTERMDLTMKFFFPGVPSFGNP